MSSEVVADVMERYQVAEEAHGRFAKLAARGVPAVKRWASFHAFLQDMGLPPTADHRLQRLKRSRAFGPGNCRWTVERRDGGHGQ